MTSSSRTRRARRSPEPPPPAAVCITSATSWPGSYIVAIDTATVPAGYTQTFGLDSATSPTAAVTVAADENRTDVDFGYWRFGSIGDRVWVDYIANGVQMRANPASAE